MKLSLTVVNYNFVHDVTTAERERTLKLDEAIRKELLAHYPRRTSRRDRA